MVLQKGNKSKNINIKLNIENIATNTTKSVELLRVTIAIKFNFEEHISVRCRKASLQLNAMNRLQKKVVKKEEIITNSFISSNFDHCPLVQYFCFCKSTSKIEQVLKRCLRIMLSTKNAITKLRNSSRTTMIIKRVRNLPTEKI